MFCTVGAKQTGTMGETHPTIASKPWTHRTAPAPPPAMPGAIGGTAPASSTGFAAFRLGICVVGGIWLWCIARREGLATVRQMIDFASLASTHPGSWGDRALRFTSRWFWTLWFALSALMYALGSGIGIARGQTDASNLIAPAFMLLIGTIPYTWERACARNARTGQSRE